MRTAYAVIDTQQWFRWNKEPTQMRYTVITQTKWCRIDKTRPIFVAIQYTYKYGKLGKFSSSKYVNCAARRFCIYKLLTRARLWPEINMLGIV